MPNTKCRVEFIELSSDEPDVVSKAVSNISTAAQYSKLNHNASFEIKIRLALMDGISVWESSSSTGFSIATQAKQHPSIQLHFVEKGRSLSRTNNSAIDASAGTAYLLRDVVKHDLISEPGTSQICVTMSSARYMGLLADISSMHCTANSNQINLQCLKDAAKLLVSVSSLELPAGEKSLGPNVFTEAFLAIFIQNWPRQCGDRNNLVAWPFYVKHAIYWMHANATRKITLEALAAASGVSVRTLQLGFRKATGLSPMGYLTNFRLECAYKDLLTEPETTTIDDISRRWGFTNPGKFSAQIRQKYGRNPLAVRKAQ